MIDPGAREHTRRANDLLYQSLAYRDSISSEEKRLLENLPFSVQEFDHDAEMVREGSRPSQSVIVIEGLATRTHFLKDGGRQISAVHTPGDFVDLQGFTLRTMDHSVTALGRCVVGLVPHEELRRITETNPHLTRMLWLLTTIDAAVQRAWIVAMGKLQAEPRLAHLFCEIYSKLDAFGLIENQGFHFPARQHDAADMLGTSTVHINRTIQSLRARKLIDWIEDRVTIHSFNELAEFSGFESRYLHLHSEAR